MRRNQIKLLRGLLKKLKIKDFNNNRIQYNNKENTIKRYIFGGSIFGLGWALVGACPGPMFTLVGNGYLVMLVVILSATLGTFVYGLVRHKLPH